MKSLRHLGTGIALCCAFASCQSVDVSGLWIHERAGPRTEVPQKTLALTPPAGYTPGASLRPSSSGQERPWAQHRHCTVVPLGWDQDDSVQILAAVDACGIDGIITLPAPFVYTIKTRLYMRLVRSTLNVFGTLSFIPDLGYWTQNAHRIEFQNQSTAWIVEGQDYRIDGGGWMQGGINGNGQAWYTNARGQSNMFGRPISLSIYNSTNVTVQNFSIRQPQFWSFYIQDSQEVVSRSIYINGTNSDPQGNSSNYETNVDGMDSVRVNNLTVADWVFHGGDDCLAPKGNTTNMIVSNLTCVGGGIAFGSVGQYRDAPDYIANVSVSNVTVQQLISPQYGGAHVSGGAYFKSWVGVEAGIPPQGGGGGTGVVSNVTFTNLRVENTTQAVYINKCYYKVASQANFCDTSTFVFENMFFDGVSGSVSSSTGVNLNCSSAAPCHDLSFKDVNLQSLQTDASASVNCTNAERLSGIVCS